MYNSEITPTRNFNLLIFKKKKPSALQFTVNNISSLKKKKNKGVSITSGKRLNGKKHLNN
jgi:hypothetical protein